MCKDCELIFLSSVWAWPMFHMDLEDQIIYVHLWIVISYFILLVGVLYLQYGDETKQLRMPNEITSTDTIRALFVSAFPQQLTMKMLESPSVAIYIKDESRNIYYELCDVR